MKITKQQLRQIIKEEILKEVSYPLPPGFRKQIEVDDIESELDMNTLMDPKYGPDWVYGELAGEFAPAFDDDAVKQRALGILKDAARQGDVSIESIARRLAKLVNR